MLTSKFLYVLLVFLVFPIKVFSREYISADSAFYQAEESNIPVLMVFSGSDWCPNCIRFDKKVLHTETFTHYANENLIILRVDFPQRTKLAKNITVQNERLAEEYNPLSTFPKVLLLSSDLQQHREINYLNENAEDFVATLIKLRWQVTP